VCERRTQTNAGKIIYADFRGSALVSAIQFSHNCLARFRQENTKPFYYNTHTRSRRPPFYRTQTIINSHSARRFPPLTCVCSGIERTTRTCCCPTARVNSAARFLHVNVFYGPSNLAVNMRVQTAGARNCASRGATCCRCTVKSSAESKSNIRSQRPFNCVSIMRSELSTK
jgi:hypothetical protein